MLDQLINGLVIGNLYALTAIGITMIYGVTNVVNFAHGSLYMLGAFFGWVAISQLHVPFVLALVLVPLATAAVGVVVEGLAIRPFAKMGRTVLLLSTIAVAMVIDQGAQLLWGPQTNAFINPLPTWRFQVGGGSIGAADLLIVGVGVGTALVLHLFLSRTKLGWAVRATAQDRDAAQQMGIDVSGLSRLAFGIAGALAGVSGLLVGIYYQNVYPTMGAGAGLKGFAAALLGSLGNIPGAIAGSYLLGVSESYGVAFLGSSYRDLIAVALLIGVLLVKPGGLFAGRTMLAPEPTTGTFLATGKPVRLPNWLLVGAGVVAVALPFVWENPYIMQVGATAWVFGIVAVSLNLIAGTTGQVSLGHAGFLAIGAYASAILTSRAGIPFGLSLVLSPAIAAVIGVVICFPALRLKGQYLSIATMALGQGIALVALNWESLTRGPMGISNIAPPSFFGYEIVSASDFYLLAFAVMLVAIFVLRRFTGSYLGRALRAVREDEVAAQAYGIGLERYKSIAFGVSAFFAAVAGTLLAHSYSYIAPDSFPQNLSIQILTMVVLGGMDSIAGAVLGAFALIVLPETARFMADYRFLIYGLLLLILLRFRPRGIMGGRA